MLESTRSQSQRSESTVTPATEIARDCHSESRVDPITGDWTIYAPHRSARPEEFVTAESQINRNLVCPFCSENEDATLPAVWVGKICEGVCHTDSAGGTDTDWSVRVVPNLYPAVSEVPSAVDQTNSSPLFTSGRIFGGHDVFVESRQHVPSLSHLDLNEVHLTFLAYRDRIRFWRAATGIAYISLFKNVGERAGASLRHSHSQLIATDRVPAAVESAVKRMNQHRAETGCCLHCDLIRGEQAAKQRIVWQDESLIAFCPFASRLPMLLRITTRQHQARFEDLNDGTIESVSRLVHRAVSWLESIRPGTAYNIALSTTPPANNEQADSFHWSIDLFPRMTHLAGFEWSSGCHINPVLPETSAAAYRKIVKSEDPRTTT